MTFSRRSHFWLRTFKTLHPLLLITWQDKKDCEKYLLSLEDFLSLEVNKEKLVEYILCAQYFNTRSFICTIVSTYLVIISVSLSAKYGPGPRYHRMICHCNTENKSLRDVLELFRNTHLYFCPLLRKEINYKKSTNKTLKHFYFWHTISNQIN